MKWDASLGAVIAVKITPLLGFFSYKLAQTNKVSQEDYFFGRYPCSSLKESFTIQCGSDKILAHDFQYVEMRYAWKTDGRA